jgi:glycosyltransferase involved in cell wall biosynthesis
VKICLTINSSPWSSFKGGGQLAVHHLASALSAKGHKVYVLYSKYPQEQFDLGLPYSVQWVRHYDFATVNLNIFSYSKALRPLAKKERFDIIHGNAEEAYWAGKIARENNSAYVFTSHTPNIPTGGVLKGMVNPIKFLKNINTYLLRKSILEGDLVIAYSHFSRSIILKGLADHRFNKVKVVPPGVENSWFDIERKLSTNQHLLFWGRLEDEKGLPELFYALKEVTKKFKKTRLTLVGEGNKLKEYKKLVAALNLTEQVKFKGWLDTEEIQNLTKQSYLGLFPSRIESFGLSVIEAMAAGLPVIAARGGAVPENIENGVTGTLVPVNDSGALAKAIIFALENQQYINALAKIGRKVIREKFSWDKAADIMIDLYRSVVRNGI